MATLGAEKRKARHEERERCLALVAAYRQSVERKFAKIKTPSEQNRMIVERVVEALMGIERHIENPKPSSVGSDFSIEEIAMAEEIIAEQEKNPFEA